jgi:dihydroflavonol-4-reductase
MELCPDYNSSDMKALVTGSTGFVGANLVGALGAAGHAVRALHRPHSQLEALSGLAYEPVTGDVLDLDSLVAAMAGVDWVFHVAGVADYWRQGSLARLYHVNVGGTRRVLKAACRAGVRRVVFTSSAGALGLPALDGGQLSFLNERSAFNVPAQRFPYGHSKYLAEKVVQEFVARGMEAVIVNPTVVLGPRDVNFIAGSIIREIYRGRVPATPPGGTNYIDVMDVVRGHIAAAAIGQVGERYILAGHNLSHRQVLQTIAGVVGVSPPRWQLPCQLVEPFAVVVDIFNRLLPGIRITDGNQVRLMRYKIFFDGSKARRELELGSPLPFRASVERAYLWYRDNGYL